MEKKILEDSGGKNCGTKNSPRKKFWSQKLVRKKILEPEIRKEKILS